MPVADDALRAATDELFLLDPGDFVAARNDLVRTLRKAGDRDLAARVAELRRPGPAAWAVNRLARLHGEDVERLVALGQALRDAQAQALEGADAQMLRRAGRARREAVGGLADVALAFLAERGSGAEGHAGEIVATLEAASLDPEAGEAVRAGRLTAGLAPPSGFGDGGPEALGPEPVPARRPPRTRTPPADIDAADQDRRAAESDRRARLERARSAVGDARRLAAGTAADAGAADQRAAECETGLAEAEARATTMERELEEARGSVDSARRALDVARKAAARARTAAADAARRIVDAEARVEELGRQG